MNLTRLAAAALGLSLFTAVSLKADPVTVQEIGIGANETVYINSSLLGNNLHVYAGVVNLLVNGVPTAGFCIDPWHWSSSSPQVFNSEALELGPKPPGPMGAAAALQIEQLWQAYYTPAISNIVAAALQIKIWQIVDAAVLGATFQLNSVDGADSAAVYAQLATMTTFLANNPGAPAASLIAVSGPGQDYVIPGSVPDSTATLGLLGLGLMGLVAMRKKFAV